MYPLHVYTYIQDCASISPQVTTDGDLVFEMDSTHKKPYETLLIGRKSHVPLLHHKASSRSSEQGQLHCSAEHTSSESIVPKSTHNLELLDITEPPHSCVTGLPSCTTAVRRQDGVHTCSSSDSELDAPQAKRCRVIRLDTVSDTSDTNCDMQDCSKPGDQLGELSSGIPIPYHNIVVSVPSSIHSQKPYLGGWSHAWLVLRQYIPPILCCSIQE